MSSHNLVESILKKILKASNYKNIKEVENKHGHIDLVAESNDGCKIAFEIKVYSKNISIGVKQLFRIYTEYNIKYDKYIVVSFGKINKEVRKNILDYHNKKFDNKLEIWTISKIYQIIREIENDEEKINLYKEVQKFTEKHLDFVKIDECLQEISQQKDEEKPEKLIEKLRNLKTGRQDASKFEKLASEIIKYCFLDLGFIYEKMKTKSQHNEYDCIAKLCEKEDENTSDSNDFFNIVKKQFSSRYIVFEFKNYSKKITQKEILLTSKYLYHKAFRSVAIIFARKGIDKNGYEVTNSILREQGKLILILDDKDIERMIKDRNIKIILTEKLDDFLMNLEA